MKFNLIRMKTPDGDGHEKAGADHQKTRTENKEGVPRMEAVSQTKQKFESLDELRAFLLKTKDLSEIYSQKDIIDAIAHLNVTEEETEELLAWMEENMISSIPTKRMKKNRTLYKVKRKSLMKSLRKFHSSNKHLPRPLRLVSMILSKCT